MINLSSYFVRNVPQPATNTVTSARSELAGAEALSALGQSISQFGGVVGKGYIESLAREQHREAASYTAESLTSLQISSLEKLKELQTTPNPKEIVPKFAEFFGQEEEKIRAGAPNQVATDLLTTRLAGLREMMVSKAIGFQAQEEVSQQRLAIRDSVDNIVMAVGINPAGYSQYQDQITEVLDGGLAQSLPTSDRMELKQAAQGQLAKMYIRSLMNRSPELADQALRQENVSSNLSPADYMSAQEGIARLRDQRAREGLALQHKQVKAFMDDPVSLAIMNGADPDDPDDILNKQYLMRNGAMLQVPEARRSLLTKDQAAVIADQIIGVGAPEELVTVLEQIKDKYGDNTDVVLRDLAKADLPSHYKAMLRMDPVQDVLAFKALFNANKMGSKDVIKSADDLNRGGKPIDAQITRKIADRMAVLRREYRSEKDLIGIQDAMRTIASYQYTRGYDLDDAIEIGTKWFLDQDNVVFLNDVQLRIPVQYSASKVKKFLNQSLDEFDFSSIKGMDRRLVSYEKDRASFILSEDETGYVMVDGLGIPYIKDGQQIRVNFADIFMKSE